MYRLTLRIKQGEFCFVECQLSNGKRAFSRILEDKYGKIVDEMYLVCLHPENKNKDYQRIKVVDLQTEVSELFDLRRKEIANKA